MRTIRLMPTQALRRRRSTLAIWTPIALGSVVQEHGPIQDRQVLHLHPVLSFVQCRDSLPTLPTVGILQAAFQLDVIRPTPELYREYIHVRYIQRYADLLLAHCQTHYLFVILCQFSSTPIYKGFHETP